MSNPLKLIPGRRYRVVRSFVDYDRNEHQPGGTWIFLQTNFLPYEDGLTVHLLQDGNPRPLLFRLQWRKEEQAHIIENFLDYVEAIDN